MKGRKVEIRDGVPGLLAMKADGRNGLRGGRTANVWECSNVKVKVSRNVDTVKVDGREGTEGG